MQDTVSNARAVILADVDRKVDVHRKCLWAVI